MDAPEAEPLQSYVIVMKEDVIEAIGMYVAAYLANVPEAANLQPAELQAALCRSLKVGSAPNQSTCFQTGLVMMLLSSVKSLDQMMGSPGAGMQIGHFCRQFDDILWFSSSVLL